MVWSNKYFLKVVRDNMPESAKYAVAGIIRNKLIRNKDFLDYHNLLKQRHNLETEKIKEYQFAELKKTLVYAFSNVPYYNQLFKQVGFVPEKMVSFDDIKVIPFLTKQILHDNFDKLISTKEVEGGYYSASSGGSSGRPTKVLHDYRSIFVENAFIYHFRRKLGYNFSDRLITFRGVDLKGKMWKYQPMYNEYIFSPFRLSGDTVKTYVKKIDELKPDFLHGYLSSIYYFAKLLSEQNLILKKPIKGIFLISENINQSWREFIESYFETRSMTFYGHTERCIIAEETDYNTYSFDPYYGYTELIENSDETKNIVGTGFLNKTMPLIRYKTDDSCIKSGDGYRIAGKWESDAGIYGSNMEYFTHAAFTFHSNSFNNVIQSQYFQEEKGKATLLIIPNDKFNNSDLNAIKKEVTLAAKGKIDFDFKIVNKLNLTPRGKLSMFHTKVKRDN